MADLAAMRLEIPNLRRSVVWRIVQSRPALLATLFLVVLGLCSIFAGVLAPYSPTVQDLFRAFEAPSRDYWFGTDDLGRDILSRVLYGARVSLRVAVLATIVSATVGTLLGLVSGWWTGMLDNVIMRVMDALLAFPTIVLALGIIAMLGPSMNNAMLAIGIVGTPVFARLVRSQVLALRERPFVEAARALGRREWGIIWRHSLPNMVPVIIVQTSLRMAEAVLAESALSFLGMGVQPPTPSLGMMLNDARGYMLHAPWIAVAPGLTIFLTVLSINLLGDSVRDVLDPRLRGQLSGASYAGG